MNEFNEKTRRSRSLLIGLAGLCAVVAVAVLLHGCRSAVPEPLVMLRTGEQAGPFDAMPRPGMEPPLGIEKSIKSPKIYTVRKGDTLSHISLRFGLSQNQLCKLNGITNPNMIRAGQKLRLWTSGGMKGSRKAPEIVYTIQKGDSLWSIAHQADTTVALLRTANVMGKDTIYPGQQLRIPDYRVR